MSKEGEIRVGDYWLIGGKKCLCGVAVVTDKYVSVGVKIIGLDGLMFDSYSPPLDRFKRKITKDEASAIAQLIMESQTSAFLNLQFDGKDKFDALVKELKS